MRGEWSGFYSGGSPSRIKGGSCDWLQAPRAQQEVQENKTKAEDPHVTEQNDDDHGSGKQAGSRQEADRKQSSR